MPELKKKQGNRCTNFMRRNSALSCYSLSNCTGIDQNRTKMEDTEHLQLCLCLSLIYSRAKNASNGILNSETPFESKCYMSMTTAEEMLGCACFLACKMRNTDCTHTHTHTHYYRQINLVSEQTRILTITAERGLLPNHFLERHVWFWCVMTLLIARIIERLW